MRPTLKPTRLFFQVTDRCEAGCAHCGFDCRPRGSGCLDPVEAEAFLDAFCARFGPPSHLALTGGEPMLEPDLTRRLARLAADRGMVVRLVTNAGWAGTRQQAVDGLAALADAGVAGLWVSAGAFHDRVIPRRFTRHLLHAAEWAGMPAYLNFAYLRPLAAGMRGKGLVEVDARIGDDLRTARLQATWAQRLPIGCHGWARIWDTGRARALISGLGDGLARTVRSELQQAEACGDGLEDLIGLGLDGRVFVGERQAGQTRPVRFDAWLSRLA